MPMQSYYCIFSFCIFTLLTNSSGTQLIIVNKCNQSIWPGILGTTGHESPNNGGFSLYSGEQVVLNVPDKWSGRIWARQGCCFDQHGKGSGSCQTGDCGGGLLHCMGTGGQPPATVVEMTFGTPQNPLHYYDVTLVDGFNLPVSMVPLVPHGGCGCGCEVAACEADLNGCCPASLAIRREGKVVGCKSVCLATMNPKDCCTGEFANPANCKPTVYANLFKALCPRAYSYAFDESTGLNRCNASQYVITFCPPKA